MRLFADLRPKDVAGMVLVDPSIEYQDLRFAAAFGRGAGSTAPLRDKAERCLEAAQKSASPMLKGCTPDAKRDNIANLRTQVSEADAMWGATSDEIDAGRYYYYGDMPLIVLTADGTYASVPEPGRQAVSDFWRRLHDEIAAHAAHGSNRLVAHSGHMMMFDRPDAITDAVTEVITKARK